MASFEEMVQQGLQEGAPAEQPAAPASPQASFESLVSNALASAHAPQGVNAPPGQVTAIPRMSMQSLYGRKDLQGRDVPIDESSGIPMGDYWHIAFQSDPEARAQALQKMYPDRKVRVLETGDITLEIPDSATGQMKDVSINPKGISKEDFVDLVANAPEIAAMTAVALATGGTGFMRTLAQIVLSSGAGGIAGGVKDVSARASEGIPVRPKDILRDQTANTLMNMGGEAFFGSLGKAMRVLSPFADKAQPGSLAFNLNRGVEFLKKNYDSDFVTTPAMRTGSTALAAIEAAESPMPGSRTVIDKLRAKNDRAVQEAQALALGQVPSVEQVGEQAVGELANKVVAPLDSALREAQRAAIKKGDTHILDTLDEIVGVPRGASRLTAEDAGDITKAAYDRRVMRAQEAVNKDYARVDALLGSNSDVLNGDAAASAAAAIRKELPAVLKKIEKETGLVDEAGRAITRSGLERQQLPSGIPEGLEKALTDLEALKGGKVSLQTLTALKNSAYDAISAFRSVHPDRKDRWFNKIAAAYEKGIQAGIDATDDAAIKDALKTARDTYKREMLPLERPGLRELAKGEFDTGQLSPEQITDRLFTGPRAWKNYSMLKETLGADNVALRAVKRAWIEEKVARATIPGLDILDTQALKRTFHDLNAANPKMATELLGDNYHRLQLVLSARGAMENLDAIDGNVLRTFLNLKDPTVDDLTSLVKMSTNRAKAYANGILKDISDGLPIDDLKPTEFVARMRNPNVPTEQVETILSKLNPKTRQDIATVEMYRILTQATLRQGETAAQVMQGGAGNLSANKILDAIGDGAKKERTLLLLGPDLQAPYGKGGKAPPKLKEGFFNREDTLKALVDVLAPKDAAKTAFDASASLGAGMVVRTLLRNPLKYATSYTKNMFAALAYTRGFGRIISNKAFDDEASAVAANTMIASEPFIRASIDVFGAEATNQLIADAKNSLDQFVLEMVNSPEGRRRAAMRRFAGGEAVPVRMEAGPATNETNAPPQRP